VVLNRAATNMTGLRVGTLSLLFLSLLLVLGQRGAAERVEAETQALPLEVAEIVPLSREELLHLADAQLQHAHVPIPNVDESELTFQRTDLDDPLGLAEMKSRAHMQAQAAEDGDGEGEGDADGEGSDAGGDEDGSGDDSGSGDESGSDEASAGGSDAGAISGGPKPDKPMDATQLDAPAETIEGAIRLLKKHRDAVRSLEQKIEAQTQHYNALTNVVAIPTKGAPTSSGSQYWEDTIEALKSSDGTVVGDHASELRRTDARCVICQYIVQQTIGVLQGKPMTVGGATAGGKRAAADWLKPAAGGGGDDEGESFVELESTVQAALKAQSELEATAELVAEADLESEAASQMESEEGVGAEAEAERYGRLLRRRSRRSRVVPVSETGVPLRNVAAQTYPRQLNDWGFEAPTRNRRSDILEFRPRTARFTKNVEALKAKWDQTRATYKKLYTTVYDSFERLCSHRMPLAYMPFCQEMLKDYRYIAQGIQFGDRAQTICMNGNWCDRKSYVRNAVHAYFVREKGDA
jgi:hypothetical protein